MSALDDAVESFGQQQATPTASGGASPLEDAIRAMPNTAGHLIKNEIRSSPQYAIPESPLSPMERGAFGWLKNPIHQQEYLEGKFGKGNVELSKMDDKSANFIVKDKEGQWRQVDPQGLSDIPLDVMKGQFGKALSRITSFNLKNTLGGAAQFLGEHGLDSAGAVEGGATGAAIGSALGPVGSLGGGVVGGALGGLAGGAIDTGIRQSLQTIKDLTGHDIPGAEHINQEDLQHQLLGSMMFGASQELAAPFLKASGKGAVSAFTTLLSKLGGSNPESKQAQAALIHGLSGMKEGLSRIWADDPKGVGNYIPDAIKDRINATDNIKTMQKTAVNDLFDSAQSARAKLGQQYDAIEGAASGKRMNVLSTDSDGKNGFINTLQKLVDDKYINQSGELLKPGTGELSAETSGANGQAIRRLVGDMQSTISKGGDVSYKDLKIMDRNIENFLFGQNQITDGNLRRILMEHRAEISTLRSKGLHDVSPELSKKFADLNETYGPVKELLGLLGQKSEDTRADAFLKQVIRDDGSYNAELMNSVSKLLGIDNPTKDILHMEVARHSAPWFTGSGSANILGVKLPASPGLTRGVVNNVLSPYQELTGGIANGIDQVKQKTNEAVAPYLRKFHDAYKTMPQEVKDTLMKTPQAISTLGQMISGAVVSEKQTRENLLKQSGAFQGSQFGQ